MRRLLATGFILLIVLVGSGIMMQAQQTGQQTPQPGPGAPGPFVPPRSCTNDPPPPTPGSLFHIGATDVLPELADLVQAAEDVTTPIEIRTAMLFLLRHATRAGQLTTAELESFETLNFESQIIRLAGLLDADSLFFDILLDIQRAFLSLPRAQRCLIPPWFGSIEFDDEVFFPEE